MFPLQVCGATQVFGQETTWPQLLVAFPQAMPAHVTDNGSGTQAVQVFPLQVSGAAQVSGQLTVFPQLSTTEPHSTPEHVTPSGSGTQTQLIGQSAAQLRNVSSMKLVFGEAASQKPSPHAGEGQSI